MSRWSHPEVFWRLGHGSEAILALTTLDLKPILAATPLEREVPERQGAGALWGRPAAMLEPSWGRPAFPFVGATCQP